MSTMHAYAQHIMEQQFPRLKIGISSCLLGNPVRFDGNHKKNSWIVDELSKASDFVPVCPELEMGLGVPRPSIFLEKNDSDEVRLVDHLGNDLSALATSTAKRIAPNLETVHGHIFKNKSPSCGLERVKVFNAPKKISLKEGVGIYAGVFKDSFPLIPTVEEGRLEDPIQREHFLMRIFSYAQMLECSNSFVSLQSFHQRCKLLLMSYSPTKQVELGRLLSDRTKFAFEDIIREYQAIFMATLNDGAVSKGRNINALEHIHGYFKKVFNRADRELAQKTIQDYRDGIVPFIMPLNLYQHFAQKYEIAYIQNQRLLSPYPRFIRVFAFS